MPTAAPPKGCGVVGCSRSFDSGFPRRGLVYRPPNDAAFCRQTAGLHHCSVAPCPVKHRVTTANTPRFAARGTPHCIAFRPPFGAQGAQLAHGPQRIAGTDRRTTDGNNPFTTPLRHADRTAIASDFARNATAIRSRNPATTQAIYRRFAMEFRHVL